MKDHEKELHLHVLHGLMDALGKSSLEPFASKEPKDGVVITKEFHKEIPMKDIMGHGEAEEHSEMPKEEDLGDHLVTDEEEGSPSEEVEKFKPRWMKK